MSKRKMLGGEPPGPDVTRFRIKLDFLIEVDGAYGLPDLFSEKYKTFLVLALAACGFDVPVRLLPDSKCECHVVNASQVFKRRTSRMMCMGGKWVDRARGEAPHAPITIKPPNTPEATG